MIMVDSSVWIDYFSGKDTSGAEKLDSLLGDTTIALKSAANFRTLRKKGITVRKTIDTIIATYCIENKLPLLHSDKDFQPFHQHLKLKNALAGT